jgi:hypothetical protein
MDWGISSSENAVCRIEGRRGSDDDDIWQYEEDVQSQITKGVDPGRRWR